MTEILNAITTIGFPIVACIGIGWYAKYTNDNYRNDMKEATAQHKDEMSQLSQALQNNTLALQKLCTMLEKEEKDHE